MANFHNFGVPEYAHMSTPAIRPREIKLPDAEQLERRAAKMLAYNYVKKYLDDNWKEGQRFFFTAEKRQVWDYTLQSWLDSGTNHANQKGVFHRRFMIGSAWFVEVTWDDPEYKPKGLGTNKVGMFDFYHFAFHEGSNE